MYTQNKHKELKGCMEKLQRTVSKMESEQYDNGFDVIDKLSRINSKLESTNNYLSKLLEMMSEQQVKKVNPATSVTPSNPLKYAGGVVRTSSVKGVMVKDSSTDDEAYQSPEEPVYKHFYYYDVEDETDGSHSKYSRLADIASDLGASDSAPHYAMTKGTLFLGRYRINKVDTDVKVNVVPQHEPEEGTSSIQIV